ncbi:G-D-S-L family lipolytic protein [Brunnivagina elsteri CCALA 953]|uniref:G-D-S-L family lipolytic protein n=2 Tax=Brunnivagina TaxID=3344733 RepID=A0A2A2TP81_9CYAN|nr:G-D-S-L family lipolytic protein [Calothrix elsteri CCALA 953]
MLFWRQERANGLFSAIPAPTIVPNPSPTPTPELGKRHKLTYKQWEDVLRSEANIAAIKRPQRLTVLAGDSLSLWFPTELLPQQREWLNQGISGETSEGLFNRLDIFDKTQPETILVMIGINDFVKGISDEDILENHRKITAYLQKKHPKAQLVIQSILPHGGENATWEGRDKLLAISNHRIRELNEKLKDLATKQNIKYLDLHPLFADNQGNLRNDLSTDGLHLSKQGYLVWRSALQLYSNMMLEEQKVPVLNNQNKSVIPNPNPRKP